MDAQADLDLRWSHKSYRRFCPALAHKFWVFIGFGSYILGILCKIAPVRLFQFTRCFYETKCSKYLSYLSMKANVVDTLRPLYNTVHYNTVLDITQFKDGSQKCIDYIEK